jgi:hypothetical protein
VLSGLCIHLARILATRKQIISKPHAQSLIPTQITRWRLDWSLLYSSERIPRTKKGVVLAPKPPGRFLAYSRKEESLYLPLYSHNAVTSPCIVIHKQGRRLVSLVLLPTWVETGTWEVLCDQVPHPVGLTRLVIRNSRELNSQRIGRVWVEILSESGLQSDRAERVPAERTLGQCGPFPVNGKEACTK